MVTKEVRKWLKEKYRDPSYKKTGLEEQRRSIGYTSTITAKPVNGTCLQMLLVHCKDNCFNDQNPPAQLFRLTSSLYMLTIGTNTKLAEEESDLVFGLSVNRLLDVRQDVIKEDLECTGIPVNISSSTYGLPASVLSKSSASRSLPIMTDSIPAFESICNIENLGKFDIKQL